MERYKLYAREMKDRLTNKRRFSSTFYPVIPHKDSDVYIYSKRSDKLDILAYKYYGDQTLWWVIGRTNNLGKGTLEVPPGRRLRIPYPMNEFVLSQIKEAEENAKSTTTTV